MRKSALVARLAAAINRLAERFGYQIVSYRRPGFSHQCVSVAPEGDCRGSALLSYIVEPFLLKPGEAISNAHQHDWVSYLIGRSLLELGYEIDVVDYRNEKFAPKKQYRIFVGARTNFRRLAGLLDKDCVKIVHLDTAHWVFHNAAQYGRLLDIQRRKGVALKPRKLIEESWALEVADYATANAGPGFNIGTYDYATKEIYEVPIPSCVQFDWIPGKDFESAKRRFLWMGSGGLVHKGLDLVLEAFSQTPDVELTVCGPVQGKVGAWQDERQDGYVSFEAAYHQELYECTNIHVRGWIDVGSEEFLELAKQCVAVVFASCSEGGAGSVLTCMQAGLIPVVSYESNIETGDFGVVLETNSVERIRESVSRIAGLPATELAERAKRAWEYARTTHTKEKFFDQYKSLLGQIVKQRHE